MMRVAINGFGRIGRLAFKAALDDPEVKFIAVNDLTDTKTLAHLLKYDTVHGKFKGSVSYDEDHLVINKESIQVFKEKDPSDLPWADLKIDVVLECTGRFTDRDGASKHLKAGAKKVLISAPAKNPDITIVKGVNDQDYDKDKHHIISNASCSTNCLAPMVKVLHDNFKIKRGYMVTAHGYTASQNIVDGPHKDLRRARAAAVNLVPTGTGAARAISLVMPELEGKLDAHAIRVPIPDGSMMNLVVEVEQEADEKNVNWLFENVSKSNLKGVVEYSKEPLVSSDIVGNPASCIFDSDFTKVLQKTMISVSGWYDNEWGYSCRLIDVLKMLV